MGLIRSQTYPTHRGSNARIGRHNLTQIGHYPGTGHFEWSDPQKLTTQKDLLKTLKPAESELDSMILGANDLGVRRTSGWIASTANQKNQALNLELPGENIQYYYTYTTLGATQTFQWRFSDTADFPIKGGDRIEIYVNIPIGSTQISDTLTLASQTNFIYQISGVGLDDQDQVLLNANGESNGGFIKLGGVFTVAGDKGIAGTITLSLLNKLYRGTGQNLADSVGQTLVYAGAAEIKTAQGSYLASPIVGELQARQDSINTSWRVIAAKNEPVAILPTQENKISQTSSIGIVTTYTHDNSVVEAANVFRAGRIWSWPIVRPLNSTESEISRFEQDKIDYISSNANNNPNALTFVSTPLLTYARVKTDLTGNAVGRDVVIACREDGTVFCLDAKGNVSLGSTEVFWSHKLPTGFGFSSPLVQTFTERDVLYIACKDNRIYALDMAGVGDGTTTRIWVSTNAFINGEGSVAMYTDSSHTPISLIVPTLDKGIIFLDPLKGTLQRMFNSAGAIGEINMTPAIEFDNIYFGDSKNNFYAVNALTADQVWMFRAQEPFGNASPATVPAAELTYNDVLNSSILTMANTVFCVDALGIVYALNAATGAQIWISIAEIGNAPSGSISFTRLNIEDDITNGFLGGIGLPVIFVPRVSGSLGVLLANTDTTNADGSRHTIWDNNLTDEGYGISPINSVAIGAQLSNEETWMYLTDQQGNLLAFQRDIDDDDVPIKPSPKKDPKDPKNAETAKQFRAVVKEAKIGFLSSKNYEDLLNNSNNRTINNVASYVKNFTRRDFEYGEQIYFIIYNLKTNSIMANPELDRMTMTARLGSLTITGAIKKIIGGDTIFLFKALADCTTSQIPPRIGRNTLTFNAKIGVTNVSLQSIPYADRTLYLAHPLGISIQDHQLKVDEDDKATVPNVSPDEALGVFWQLNTSLYKPASESIGPQKLDQVRMNRSGLNYKPQEEEEWKNKPMNFGRSYAIRQYFAPSKNEVPLVAPRTIESIPQIHHGETAYCDIYIWDRSLMNRLNKKLNIRILTKEFNWKNLPRIINEDQIMTDDGYGIINPLNETIYAAFEEPPYATSLDYPDIDESNLSVVADPEDKNLNALKNNVELNAFVKDSDKDEESLGVSRMLTSTRIQFQLKVPRFQPPNKGGYEAKKLVAALIPSNRTSNMSMNNYLQRPYREFNLEARIAVDPKVEIVTNQVDLKKVTPGTVIDLSNKKAMPFEVRNIGNINLLNMRIAKTKTNGQPLLITSEEQNPSMGLSYDGHLLTSLDPAFSGGTPYGDNVVFPKPRVGDLEGTLLQLYPNRRPNTGMSALEPNDKIINNITKEPFLSSVIPKLGIKIPIGTPAGQYNIPINVFNDQKEFSTSGKINLNFKVIENQLTNFGSQIEMVDHFKDRSNWSNVQPTILRDSTGNLFVAWASNRLYDDGSPSWSSSNLRANQSDSFPKWRIYLAYLESRNESSAKSVGPLKDLDNFKKGSLEKWFKNINEILLDERQLKGIFGPAIHMSSIKLGSPVFASNVIGEEIDPRLQYLGFVAEGTKNGGFKSSGNLDSRICLITLDLKTKKIIGNAVSIQDEHQSHKSRPALVQTKDRAIAFYTSQSETGTKLCWNSFNGLVWDSTQSLDLGNEIKTIGSPTIVCRKRGSQNTIDLVFSARLASRQQNDLFYVRLNADENFVLDKDHPITHLSAQRTKLEQDPKTGIFWSIKLDYDQSNFNEFDIFDSQGISILIPNTKKLMRTGILKAKTSLGGEVTVDFSKGSSWFSNAIIPQDIDLFINAPSKIIRLNEFVSSDENIYSPTLLYDDSGNGRYILSYIKSAIDISLKNNSPSMPYLKSFIEDPVTSQLITEKREFAIPIDRPYQETGISMVLDPSALRPKSAEKLIWLIWTSQRNGSPDIYFETIAPQWGPS